MEYSIGGVLESSEAWLKEQERIRALQEEKEVLPFGYDYILETLDGIAVNLNTHTLFQGGVLLGRLIQIITENKDKE
jgi:hypothetical protein